MTSERRKTWEPQESKEFGETFGKCSVWPLAAAVISIISMFRETSGSGSSPPCPGLPRLVLGSPKSFYFGRRGVELGLELRAYTLSHSTSPFL
jgi:hypothetical protein